MKELKWFEDSPDFGHPDCKCSLCDEVIHDVPLRVFDTDKNREMRFHWNCGVKAGVIDL